MGNEGELPVSAAGDVVLFGTADAGGWVGALRVYSGGFECTLRVIRREPREPMRRVDGRRVPSTVWDGDDALRLGVRYTANGRAGELLHRHPLPGHRPPVTRDGPPLLGVQQRTGGGTPGEWDAQLWIAPLPPGGPVVFSGSWRAAGVEEFHAELDGAAIVTAAAGVTRLWGNPGNRGARGGPATGVFTIGTLGEPGDGPGDGSADGPGDGPADGPGDGRGGEGPPVTPR